MAPSTSSFLWLFVLCWAAPQNLPFTFCFTVYFFDPSPRIDPSPPTPYPNFPEKNHSNLTTPSPARLYFAMQNITITQHPKFTILFFDFFSVILWLLSPPSLFILTPLFSLRILFSPSSNGFDPFCSHLLLFSLGSFGDLFSPPLLFRSPLIHLV